MTVSTAVQRSKKEKNQPPCSTELGCFAGQIRLCAGVVALAYVLELTSTNMEILLVIMIGITLSSALPLFCSLVVDTASCLQRASQGLTKAMANCDHSSGEEQTASESSEICYCGNEDCAEYAEQGSPFRGECDEESKLSDSLQYYSQGEDDKKMAVSAEKMHTKEPEEDLQLILSESSIVTTTGSRPTNEDTHIDRCSVPGGTLEAVFDGHGGKEIAELAENRTLAILCPELQSRLEVIENGSMDESHMAVAEAFNLCTDMLHSEIRSKFLTGGSTALMIYQTRRCIYMHTMGDCRGSVSFADGKLRTAHRALVDGAFPLRGVSDMGDGVAQTPIHAMPGNAVWRDNVSHCDRTAPVVCTMESMARMRIENDDEDESAFHEWCAYNYKHCTSLINMQENDIPITHSSHPVLLPRQHGSSNLAWRLSPCGTQPTRGLRGRKERILANGQTYRYDITKEECANDRLLIAYGCDGVEDNGAVPSSKIMECVSSLEAFKGLIDEQNLLHKHWDGFESYPVDGTFRNKIQWMGDHTRTILPIDRFWQDSITKSASVLGKMVDDGSLERAFAGYSKDLLDLRCKAFVELVNLRASADNVTFGMTTFFHAGGSSRQAKG